MKTWSLALFSVLGLWAADPQQAALELRAHTDFARVQAAPDAPLADTARCVQSQAALLPVAPAAELPLVHYQKGYCSLAGGDFGAAAAEFDAAAATWRAAEAAEKQPGQPAPPALAILATVARLKAGVDGSHLENAAAEISGALASPDCVSRLMPPDACAADLATGREWLGWIDQRRGNLVAAAREFGQTSDTAWQEWIASRRAFEDRRYAEAATVGRRAVEEWDRRPAEPASINEGLNPLPDRGKVLADWGAAQLLAGDAAGAIATFDRAVKTSPTLARAYYLRARAEELAGRREAALADYSLASRTAFADAQDLVSGEAHLYRGILDYRRSEYARAESEFSSALNFGLPASLRPDAQAWRLLAAVSSGACEASRDSLARALGTVSPFFPGKEASAAMAACPAATARLQRQATP